MKKVLIVDNYDSFTYNLVHLVEKLVHHKIQVCKNDEFSMDEVARFDKILLSPGPGLPDEAGLLKPLIAEYGSSKSILGVCLGHQAIGEVFGGRLKNLDQVFHGVAHQISITKPEDPLFKGLVGNITVGRYHSWVIDNQNLPEELAVTATDEMGNIMAVRHQKFDICGVQFHPESIMTPDGEKMIRNWLFE